MIPYAKPDEIVWTEIKPVTDWPRPPIETSDSRPTVSYLRATFTDVEIGKAYDIRFTGKDGAVWFDKYEAIEITHGSDGERVTLAQCGRWNRKGNHWHWIPEKDDPAMSEVQR